MDPQTASYYRAILFVDSQDTRPLPPTLVQLHAWAVKRCQAMGLGSTIAKASALSVAMTWLSSTKEGREFARDFTVLGNMFDVELVVSDGKVKWEFVAVDTPVVVIQDGEPTPGEYLGKRAGFIDVRIAGERKVFKSTQVQLAGV